MARGKFYRSTSDRVLAGVCGGVARYFDMDVKLVRILFVLFGIFGIGIIVYIVLWIFTPEQ